MSSLAVKPIATSSPAITPCMAALPAVNPFVSLPRFFIIPAMADAACPNAMRVWSTSSFSNRAASAATPSVSWKP